MRRAVFFDIDGTVVACQTQKKLSEFMYDSKIIHFRHVIQIFLWYVGYGLGFFKETVGVRKIFYRFFSSEKKEQIDALILKSYEARVRPFLRKSFQPLIMEFKKQGYVIVAVSGTLQQFCDLIKKEFDMDYVFGTKLCVKEGFYSGDWEGAILEGSNKARFVLKFARENDIDLQKSICYADSGTDISSLELFGRAIVVAPDRKLMREAKKKGWEIFHARMV